MVKSHIVHVSLSIFIRHVPPHHLVPCVGQFMTQSAPSIFVQVQLLASSGLLSQQYWDLRKPPAPDFEADIPDVPENIKPIYLVEPGTHDIFKAVLYMNGYYKLFKESQNQYFCHP